MFFFNFVLIDITSKSCSIVEKLASKWFVHFFSFYFRSFFFLLCRKKRVGGTHKKDKCCDIYYRTYTCASGVFKSVKQCIEWVLVSGMWWFISNFCHRFVCVCAYAFIYFQCLLYAYVHCTSTWLLISF